MAIRLPSVKGCGIAKRCPTIELLLDRLRSLADEVVDLTLAPRNEELDRKYYFDEIDKHPSALANQARAKILKEVFERQSK